MAKEESKANRNSHPMQVVDLSTGEIITNNATPAEVQAVNKVQEKTVGANVKTGKPVYNLPEGAVIHDDGEKYDKKKTKKGDYVRYADGTIKQITNNRFKAAGTSASGPENYKPTYGSIEEDVEKAKEIISKHSDVFTKGTSGKNKGKWMTDGEARNALTLAEKDLLVQVSQYSGKKGDLGALDLHFGTQSSSKDSPFYGFVDGELLEYKYWQASNPDKTAEDYEALDNTDKVTNRKEFLDILGIDSEKLDPSRLTTPGDLYTEEFLKGDDGFTKKLETAFGKDSKFRESHGDDFKIGMDHVDNFKLDIEQELADVAQAEQKKENKIAAAEDPNYKQPSTDAPWWAQDVGNMLMTVGERASVKKYLPNSTPINYAKPDALYYDPSRALAANAEQTNIAAQSLNAFGNSAQAASQMSGIHGQGTQNAANILADYEAKNVGIGNQYLDKVQQATTQENIANARRMDNLFDQTTIANQQFDNSKTALNRNVFEAWKNGLTNATKTQTMNSLYPQFNVNPWDGGTSVITEGRDLQANTPPGSSSSDISKGYKQFIKDTGLPNEGRSYSAYAQQQGLPSGTRRNQRQQQREDFLSSYGRT